MPRKTQKNALRRKQSGGTKSILRKPHTNTTAPKSKKTVKWHPEVKSPKKPLGRTRSRTKAQQSK
jgi:hypothetical protein